MGRAVRSGLPDLARPSPPAFVVLACLLAAVVAGAFAGSGRAGLAAAAVGGAGALSFAVAAPRAATYCLLIALPYTVYPAEVGGFSLFLGVPLALFVSLGLLLRTASVRPPTSTQLPYAPFLVLLVIGTASALLAADETRALTRILYLVVFGVFAWAAAQGLRGRILTARGLVASVFAGAALGAVGLIAQTLIGLEQGVEPSLTFLADSYGVFGGGVEAVTKNNWYIPDLQIVRGIFPWMSAPSAGQYLMLSLVGAVWLWRSTAPGDPIRGWILAAIALLGVAVLLTFSRAAWVGIVAGIAVLSLRRRAFQAVLVVALFLAALWLIEVPGRDATFGEYLLVSTDPSSVSSSQRFALWEDGVRRVLETPFLGIGPGNFATSADNPLNFAFEATNAHNMLLDFAVELGLLGALCGIWLITSALLTAWRRRLELPFAMVVAFVVANLFDAVTYFPRNGLLVAVAFALLAAAPAPDDDEAQPAA